MEDFTIGNINNVHSVWHAMTGKGGLFTDHWLLERDAVIKKNSSRVSPCCSLRRYWRECSAWYRGSICGNEVFVWCHKPGAAAVRDCWPMSLPKI